MSDKKSMLVNLPVELYNRYKEVTKETGASLNSITCVLVDEYVRKMEEEKRTRLQWEREERSRSIAENAIKQATEEQDRITKPKRIKRTSKEE